MNANIGSVCWLYHADPDTIRFVVCIKHQNQPVIFNIPKSEFNEIRHCKVSMRNKAEQLMARKN